MKGNCSRISGRFFAGLVAVASFALLASVSARAELPLGTILESAAGRFIFGTTPRGAALAARIIGREVAAGERNALLMLALRQPELRAVNEQMTSRLNRIRARFERQFPGASDDVFGAGARALTAAETTALERITVQELDRAFIEFIPTRPPGAAPLNYAEARDAFLNPPPARTTSEQLVEGWRARPEADSSLSPGTNAHRAEVVAGMGFYGTLSAAGPEVDRLFPKSLVTAILAEEENAVLARNFRAILERAAADTGSAPATEKVQAALRSVLDGRVPAKTIEPRIRALRSGSTIALRRALGDMTLAETQLLLHGGNPLRPTADSLLGKYLQETGAATVVRTFPRGPAAGPGSTARQGPERLVVAVSEQTMPAFLKYFSGENLLGHLHTPGQGTLYLSFRAKVGSYGSMSGEMRMPTEGTIMPEILLKTSEAQRAEQFFDLASRNGSVAQRPWELPNYCATGGYDSCTHWVGNIPVGDRLVTEYKFPGAIDSYASNQVPPTTDPRVQPLRPYENSNPLVHRVWKVPGNEQLADVIGLGPQNLAGRLANPGWVAHSLTGVAPIGRVPVVFYFVGDARAPIAADFALGINAH